MVTALAEAVSGRGDARAYDVGGPTALPYDDLLRTYVAISGLDRAQVSVPLLPATMVAELAARLTDVPTSVVRSLVESLQHDMVCAEDDFRTDLMPTGHELVHVEVAIDRALADVPDQTPDQDRDPIGPMTFDPDWAGGGTGDGFVDEAIGVATDALGRALRRVTD